jgi:uncharacterized protein Yka (UPF0111/DUF47 family)
VLSQVELVTLQRSAAMLPAGTAVPIDRDDMIELLEEFFELRRLVQRFGGDLKTLARHAVTPPRS